MIWREGEEGSLREGERDAESWGEHEFGEVELGDKRLEQRLKRLANEFSQQPQAPINQASADWAATKAAYRFFENPKAAAKKIFAAHRTRSAWKGSQWYWRFKTQPTSTTVLTPKRQAWGRLAIVGAMRKALFCMARWWSRLTGCP